MPELPEVETVVRDLRRKVRNRIIVGVWTDTPKQIRDYAAPGRRLTDKDKKEAIRNLSRFKRDIIGEKILDTRRRGKNVLLDLSHGKTLLVHQKMTGHLLVGKWKVEKGKVRAIAPEAIVKDPYNGFIHLLLHLDDGKQLALSDLRKFAKVILAKTKDIHALPDIQNLGPDALDPQLTFQKFSEQIKRTGSTIKQSLLKPEVIAGIGNIYSDDILYQARVHPLQSPRALTAEELRALYGAMRRILKRAVLLRGTSTSDFRDTEGKRGKYTEYRLVYQRENELCQRCKTPIKRITIGGRSAHFCPACQRARRLYHAKSKTKNHKKAA